MGCESQSHSYLGTAILLHIEVQRSIQLKLLRVQFTIWAVVFTHANRKKLNEGFKNESIIIIKFKSQVEPRAAEREKAHALHLTSFSLSVILQTIVTSQSASGNFDNYCKISTERGNICKWKTGFNSKKMCRTEYNFLSPLSRSIQNLGNDRKEGEGGHQTQELAYVNPTKKNSKQNKCQSRKKARTKAESRLDDLSFFGDNDLSLFFKKLLKGD